MVVGAIQPRVYSVVSGLLVIGALALVLVSFDSGWLPHDDGYLAWSAERVLNGEVPHVDYDEIYTGGLSYLNAAAFRLMGPSLLALRIPLLALFFAFLACVYAVCRRGMGREWAATTAAIVVCLGPLLTPTPMPTLYNLYLGMLALYCILRYAESDRVHWLAFSGLLTGISVLVKVSGLYVLMGSAIAIFAVTSARTKRERIVRSFVLGASCIAATILILPAFTVSRFVLLLLPLYVVAWAVGRLQPWYKDSEARRAVPALIALGLGFFLPILLYAGLFAWNGKLAQLLTGLGGMIGAISGQLHLDAKPLATLLIPIGMALVVVLLARSVGSRGVGAQSCVIFLFVVAWYLLHARSLLLVIHHIDSWMVVIAAAAVGWMLRTAQIENWNRHLAVVVLSFAACFQLAKFPSANQWQDAYSLPLAVIALVVVTMGLPRRVRLVVLTVLVSFGVVLGIARMGNQIYSSATVGLRIPSIELGGDRAGIDVPVVYWYYNEVNSAIDNEQTLFASPDLPEVYFLNAQSGVGRSVFPIITEAIRPGDSEISRYEEAAPDVVVIETAPPVSTRDPDLERRIVADCGSGAPVGRLLLFECP